MGSGRCGSRRTKMLACTLYCFMSIRGASESGLARAGARQDDVAVVAIAMEARFSSRGKRSDLVGEKVPSKRLSVESHN